MNSKAYPYLRGTLGIISFLVLMIGCLRAANRPVQVERQQKELVQAQAEQLRNELARTKVQLLTSQPYWYVAGHVGEDYIVSSKPDWEGMKVSIGGTPRAFVGTNEVQEFQPEPSFWRNHNLKVSFVSSSPAIRIESANVSDLVVIKTLK